MNSSAVSGIRQFTQLGRQTPDCILLSLGEPAQDTPAPILEAACQALRSGKTHYSPNRGEPALLQALAEKWQCSSENFLITAGATGALHTVFSGLVQPEDEVLLLGPAFPLYEQLTRIRGATPIWVDTQPWSYQVEDLSPYLTPRTRLIVANSPCNPTGTVYNARSLSHLAQASRQAQAWLVWDRVYARAVDPADALPPTSRLLICDSFSKRYAMTGFRCGYVLAEKEVISRLLPYQAAQMSCVPAFIQLACVAALETDPAPRLAGYLEQARCFSRGLSLPHPAPAGGFYLFPASPIADDISFCTQLLKEGKVACVPGSFFHAPGYFRISCAAPPNQLQEALRRLEQFLQRGETVTHSFPSGQ